MESKIRAGEWELNQEQKNEQDKTVLENKQTDFEKNTQWRDKQGLKRKGLDRKCNTNRMRNRWAQKMAGH